MRILITGGAGCLGSNLIEHWLPQGHEILVIDNFVTGKREVVPALEGLTVVEGSIADSEMVTQYSGVWVAGAKEGTNIAFGYAAESYVDFGVPLMFLPVFLYGFLIGMAYHWWLGAIRHRDLAVGLATVMFWLCLYIFERSWVKTLGLTVTIPRVVPGAASVAASGSSSTHVVETAP